MASPIYPQPGPRKGSKRPQEAPNNGAMGGRPADPSIVPPVVPMPSVTTGSTTPPLNEPVQASSPFPQWDAQPAPTPVAPAAPVQPQSAYPQAPALRPPQQAQAPPAPAPVAPTSAPAPAAPAQPEALGPAALPLPTEVALDHHPSGDEMMGMPDGARLTTPLGSAIVQGGKAGSFTLNPAGAEAYRRAKVQGIQRFGSHPLSGDPNAPLPPVEPGKPSFNPFDPQGWR